MTKLTKILFAGALAVAATSAQASTMQTTFEATSYTNLPGGHSMWVSGGLGSAVGGDFDFSPAGTFKVFSSGGAVTGANLSGSVVSDINASSGFTLNFDYNVDFSDFDSGTPAYKVEGGAPTPSADNFFLNLTGGTLVGFGGLSGMNLSVVRRPEPLSSPYNFATQVGTGSNAKDPGDYGMANWFYLSVDSCTICGANGFRSASSIEGRAGDLNLDLTLVPGGPTPVPLPAGGLLLLTGLAGLVAARKKHKS